MSVFSSSSRPWRTVRVLGRGSYGVVFLAKYLKLGHKIRFHQQIAVKTARLHNAFSLIKENKTYKTFQNCPEIVQCYSNQITVEGGCFLHYNLLLEYAPGGTLANLIGLLGLPENHVRLYTRTILTALRCIHDKGYVHCDVKPSNILAFPENRAPTSYRLKLADFGSVKEPEEEIAREKLLGGFRGTRDYNPPEVPGSGLVTPAMDIWALGCTVVEMIGGCNSVWAEHRDLSNAEFARRIVESSSLTPVIPQVMSEDGKDFLRKCFQREPGERWTAEMLLGHPYVNGVESEPETETETEADSGSGSARASSLWDDPNHWSQVLQGCVCGFY